VLLTMYIKKIYNIKNQYITKKIIV